MDAARNMAVVLGERDVKTDVKAKNKSNDLYYITNIFPLFPAGVTEEELQS